MREIADFKDVNELNNNKYLEISQEAQNKFDKLMNDEKIQEYKIENLEDNAFEKISFDQEFDTKPDGQESDEKLNITEKENISNEDIIDNNRLPRSGGEWLGEPGNSEWNPDSKVIPGDRNGTNSDGKSWEKIKEEYKFDTIPFENNKPNFSDIAKGKVEIEDFSDNRRKNFVQADEKLAEQKGCSPSEVKQWRNENKYTWHEESDCKTMLKVPSEVHGNIPHDGGISEIKNQKDI